ncbi:hypothetical protein, partial [Massilia sp. PWRC2]|uniref:hypothetical protein n=1 Tax=Massilia sp. PWRC2 TaxID=2804626 RepID=UPI003CFABA68
DTIRIVGSAVPVVTSSFKSGMSSLKALSAGSTVGMLATAARGGDPIAELSKAVAEQKRDADAAEAKIKPFLAMQLGATRIALEKKIAARKQIAETEGVGVPGSGGKKANFNTAGEDGSVQAGADKAAREAARIAKLGTTGKLKTIEDAYAAERSQIAFHAQYMQEERNQDLISL